jgi:Zn finger protein HypA/HybF involved in hydrogenase expression
MTTGETGEMTGTDDEDACDADETPTNTGSLADAFHALADERRVSILRVLYEKEQDSHSRPRVPFSALYDQLDIDGTSTFSYHLDELTGVYVDRNDDGYTLTATGRRVVQTILGGVYDDAPSFDEQPLDVSCPNCGDSPVEVACENGLFAMYCPGCGHPFFRDQLQPAQLARENPEEVIVSYGQKVRRDMLLELDGVCSACSGSMTAETVPSDEQLELEWITVLTCNQCQNRVQLPPYFVLLAHPQVISFYWDRGLDITDTPPWEILEFVVDGKWRPTVTRTDPFECRVDIDCGGDELSVTIDENLRVTDATVRTKPNIDLSEENTS